MALWNKTPFSLKKKKIKKYEGQLEDVFDLRALQLHDF